MTASNWLHTEAVLLRNGKEVQEALASSVCRALSLLVNTRPDAFFGLAMLSFNPTFSLVQCTAGILEALKLVERTADGHRIPADVYDVVICAIPDPLGRLLQSPRASDDSLWLI